MPGRQYHELKVHRHGCDDPGVPLEGAFLLELRALFRALTPFLQQQERAMMLQMAELTREYRLVPLATKGTERRVLRLVDRGAPAPRFRERFSRHTLS